MKIGITTYHYSSNYGAALQVYALSRYLERLGHDVYVIDYIPNDRKKINGGKFHLVLKATFKEPVSTIKKILDKLGNVVSAIREQKFYDNFKRFQDRYLCLTKRYYSLDDLQDNPPDMDIYITGSDQVWSCGKFGFNEVFFLNFGSKDVKRISYAAGFGKPELPCEWTNSLQGLLQLFDAISVREPSGVNLIKQHAGLSVKRVVDPTLLLMDYDDVCSEDLVKEINSPYLLVYRLEQSLKLERQMTIFVNKLAQKYNLKVVTVSTNGIFKWFETGAQLYPTPDEFIGLIKNADLFVTNSFHGVIFSIINKTPFYSLPRALGENSQNTRITELLNDLNLMNRFVDSKGFDMNCTDLNIDFTIISNDLDILRRESYDYIHSVLKI